MILKNCNSENFINQLHYRKVICFGAGSLLEKSIRRGQIIKHLEDHIGFFVDNDHKKEGMKYIYNEKSFNIYSVSIFNKIDISKYVLLITTVSYDSVYEQLQQIDALKHLECYIYRAIFLIPDRDISKFLNSDIINLKNIFKQRLKNFKDIYKGKRCFIIGNGPSLKINDLERLGNEITFAVNRIYLCFNNTKWRPTYYLCCDQTLYKKDYDIINKINVNNKFISIDNAIFSSKVFDNINYYNRISCIKIVSASDINTNSRFPFSYDMSDIIYSGDTILYDIIQIAVYMGFTEIYLLGVDCNFQNEILPDGTIKKNDVDNHFTKEYDNGFENIMSAGVPTYKLQIAWQSAKEACEKVGVTIKNATRGGKLEVFERVDFDELMKDKEVF